MAVHPAAHAFRKGCSTVTSAEPHVGQRMVLRMDLQNFFPSVSRARVVPLFRMAGYPESVALALANLCVNAPPAAVLSQRTFAESNVYRRTHLPQGAPTSPALANLCAYRMDARLAGLAKACGAVYTRYADDLTFSFAKGMDEKHDVGRFLWWVNQICQQEGFAENAAKRKILRPSAQQRITGIVVNSGLSVPRDMRRTLRAILHNCRIHGLDSQARGRKNFRAYLLGLASYIRMVQPKLGAQFLSEVRALLSPKP